MDAKELWLGEAHMDRNEQFHQINAKAKAFMEEGEGTVKVVKKMLLCRWFFRTYPKLALNIGVTRCM